MWTLTAWCEVRQGFRNFRPDRIETLNMLDEGFEHEDGKGLHDFMALEAYAGGSH